MLSTQRLSYTPIEADSRLSALPIGRPEIYEIYEEAVAIHWNNKQIKYSEDAKHFRAAPKGIKQLITGILAFFATSDTLVNINITERFERELDIPEVKWFYAQQKHIENEHSLTYSTLINVYVEDPKERQRLFDAVSHYEGIRAVKTFIEKCVSSEESLGARLFRMACIEGVLFARAFAVVYYVCIGGQFPGLSESNRLISKDEGLHTVGAAKIHNTILDKHAQVSAEEAHKICLEVDALAILLGKEALFAPMQGMSEDMLQKYTRNQANVVLVWFNHKPFFQDADNPFPFMNMINLSSRSNFFEVPETNYHTGHDNNTFSSSAESTMSFNLVEDF